jgi:hypothetical protein
MMDEAEAQRNEDCEDLGLVFRNYLDLGLVAASSRACDDGVIVREARWIAGAVSIDRPTVVAMYMGDAYGDCRAPQIYYDGRH